MVTISPALMGLQRLQVLDLGETLWCAEGIAAFSAALPALARSLKRLTLSHRSLKVGMAANALALPWHRPQASSSFVWNVTTLGDRQCSGWCLS